MYNELFSTGDQHPSPGAGAVYRRVLPVSNKYRLEEPQRKMVSYFSGPDGDLVLENIGVTIPRTEPYTGFPGL